MPGWLRPAADWASRLRRVWNEGSRARSDRRSLIATRRPSRLSAPSCTSAMPPRPRSARISYRPDSTLGSVIDVLRLSHPLGSFSPIAGSSLSISNSRLIVQGLFSAAVPVRASASGVRAARTVRRVGIASGAGVAAARAAVRAAVRVGPALGAAARVRGIVGIGLAAAVIAGVRGSRVVRGASRLRVRTGIRLAALGTGVRVLRRGTRRPGGSGVGVRVRSRVIAQTRIGSGVRTGLLGGLGGTARDVEGHGVALFEGVAVVTLTDIGDGAGGTIRIDGRGVDLEALVLEVLRRRGLGESDVVV